MNARSNGKNHDVVFYNGYLDQLCERIFHSAWSMNTVFSSVLNFSILGLLRQLHRLNIQAVLYHSNLVPNTAKVYFMTSLVGPKFLFPRGGCINKVSL